MTKGMTKSGTDISVVESRCETNRHTDMERICQEEGQGVALQTPHLYYRPTTLHSSHAFPPGTEALGQGYV